MSSVVFPKIWLVVQVNGEKTVMYKPPLEGFAEWCRGQQIHVFEYEVRAQIYPTNGEVASGPGIVSAKKRS